MKNNPKLKEMTLAEAVRVHGRTNGSRSPLTLFWTGSGIEVNLTGTELWIEVEADYETYEPWISVLLNGAPISRQMLTAGRYWICLFRGMSAGSVKHVRLLKDIQAMSEDPDALLQIHALRFDGDLLPVADKPLKIEFVGDSITSGEGAIGAREEMDWIPVWFSAVHNYTALTAEALNADYRVLSQSGWGVLTSWDNNPRNRMPRIYDQVCGLLSGRRNEELGALEPNDFRSWQPDAVIVNLGTNDEGAFHNAGWQDPATGERRKKRLNEDGSYNEEDLGTVEQAIERFLELIRSRNPRARIVWVYGMLGLGLMPAIYRAVDAYGKRTGDRNVSVFQLPNMTEETVGSRVHPGRLAHERAARELAGYLRGILPRAGGGSGSGR
ncbi:SGNH/GDSL hydrolase family protein [Paenibacillus spiritus]|uniref:SGNH/GDSL hydrolase family protein n=1 Tax=Paenibacillus spiritus TaxID=2496557 RepID=A0A5J5GA87_9BACL|nr:SGNH/GDSL hydrolase family protein [Paenibacillus spiritus]KAA9005036.1 SGNH/GDSL hydrolase family protein [Paenibacillus spiritus]